MLRPESRRLALTAVTGTDDPSVGYGCGWRVSGDMVWHSGETLGFRNVIIRFTARRLTVAILTNRDAPEPYPTAIAIARLWESP